MTEPLQRLHREMATVAGSPSSLDGYRLSWPPAERGGYALIVDGTAVVKATKLVVRPTRAVLHRRGAPVGPPLAACSSDCVPILP